MWEVLGRVTPCNTAPANPKKEIRYANTSQLHTHLHIHLYTHVHMYTYAFTHIHTSYSKNPNAPNSSSVRSSTPTISSWI